MRTTDRSRSNPAPAATRRSRGTGAPRPSAPVLTAPDGTRIRLSDLPLTAYWLRCGCTGREYGVQDGDLLFCDKHADRYKVIRSQS